jgi:AcrR family transcriptional regulator
MVKQSQDAEATFMAPAGEPEMSKREARAHRILDAAATLILRWGYQKTTLDDISRQAGVAKGTVYLHWKTRDELFAALVRREQLKMGDEISQRISSDPEGATLRAMLKHSALAMMEQPFMKAVMMHDMEVLGKLSQGRKNHASRVEKLLGFTAYLELLREHGLVRTDISPRIQIYTFSAIFIGFFFIAPLMPEELTLSDEEMAEMMAETVHRTLESERSIAADELQAVSQRLTHYLDSAMRKAQAEFQKELE